MSKLDKGAKKLAGAMAGLFVFKKVGDFMADAAKAFGEQERAEVKLESIMKKVNNASDSQIKAMKDQAKEMQKVTTVGDEVTLALQAQLGTFALSSDSIMSLTEQTLNLAVANKGVNLTQEDMINVGNLVGKVMTGQVGALTRYGVTLSDAQAETIKFGTESEKAAAVAEVLGGNFGQLARDMKDSYEGQLQSFKNSWGDLKELIGEQLMPVLLALLSWGTETGIPALVEAGALLKERWESNFLGIRSIINTSVAAIKLAIDGWIAAIELLIAAWDRAVSAYEKFKRVTGVVGIKNTEDFQEAFPAPDVSGFKEQIATGNFAKGGLVPAYAANGALFSSKGTDTIPAMLTPGELVLNKAQQENLAGQLGGRGVTVNMYNPNFRDEQNANSILDQFTRAIQQANLGVA